MSQITPAGVVDRAQADSISGDATGCTSRNGGTRPPWARTSSARHASSSKVSSGGGPSSTVTTQSPQANPRTTQVSQSILVVMSRILTGTTDSPYVPTSHRLHSDPLEAEVAARRL